MTPGIQNFIVHNPLYGFIRLTRDCMIYGLEPDLFFVKEILIWSMAMYLIGKLIFKSCVNGVMERL